MAKGLPILTCTMMHQTLVNVIPDDNNDNKIMIIIK